MFTSVNSTDPEEIAASAGRGRLIKRFASLQWQLGQAIRTHVNASLGSTGGPSPLPSRRPPRIRGGR